MSTRKPHLLGISGSLRSGSYNTAILKILAEAVADRAAITIFPLDEMPLYNSDLDTEAPPTAVAALRREIGAADGIVIAAPEYNHGVSGVLKNALDWASRPFGKSTLTGKPVLTLTSSPAFTGGVRAQAQLNETLASIAAILVLRPQTVIASVHEKIKDGRLVDAQTGNFLLAGVADLLRDIDRAKNLIALEQA